MRSVTALKMMEEGVGVGKLSFGCRLMDECMGGGLPLNGINEIVGEAGAGKTQFALALSLQCHLLKSMGGLEGSTAYLCCGEGAFPVRRLEQMSRCFEAKSGISYREFMNGIHIEQCHSADDVLDTLLKKIPDMCTSKGIRMIVIDSIAGMVRTEYDSSSSKDMTQRTALLFRVAKELKWLSDIHKLCVVVINQVTASGFHMDKGRLGDDEWGSSDSNPALGLAWTHCINTRIQLRRDSSGMRSLQQNDEGCVEDHNEHRTHAEGDSIYAAEAAAATVPGMNSGSTTGSNRLLTLELSPCLPKSSCRYKITDEGVFGLP